MRPAIFLDKDGTLVENVPFNADPEKIRLTAGAAFAIPLFYRFGFKLILVSNQAGVARGYFEESALAPVHQKVEEMLSDLGARLTGFYFCPHDAPAGCECRKPRSGLFFKAAEEHGIDLEASWMIGDILDDMEAGRRAKCRTILIHQGNETEWRLNARRRPDFIVTDLAEAAWIIYQHETL